MTRFPARAASLLAVMVLLLAIGATAMIRRRVVV